MGPQTSPVAEKWRRFASGRLSWTMEGDDLVTDRYRIRPLGPGQWETTCGDRLLCVATRRSLAVARAEHDHHEIRRRRQITLWGTSAGVALLAAIVLNRWISTPLGFLLSVMAVGAFLGSLARCLAAMSRSLLDPYRTRDPWEPPDWWNPHLSR